jgi:hypothetical protein
MNLKELNLVEVQPWKWQISAALAEKRNRVVQKRLFQNGLAYFNNFNCASNSNTTRKFSNLSCFISVQILQIIFKAKYTKYK